MTDNEYCYDTTTLTAYNIKSKESLNLKDELQVVIGLLSPLKRKEQIKKILSSKLFASNSKDSCEELSRIMQSLSFEDWGKQYAPKDSFIYPNSLRTVKPRVHYFTSNNSVTFHILWVSSVIPSTFAWTTPKKITDYFYEISYDSLDYDFADYYTRKYKLSANAKCSGVHKGVIRGRNLDWYCNNSCTFLIRTNTGKHKVLAIGGTAFDAMAPEIIDPLNPKFVDSGKYSDCYKLLPFVITDGINDAGVCISSNVVPVGDYGTTKGTNPDKKDLNINLLNRYILDNADSVDHAIQLLQDRNIFASFSDELEREDHFMISDSTKTVVIEFCNNEMIVIDGTSVVDDTDGQVINPCMMTNYYLKLGLALDSHANGVERINIIKDNYDSIEDEDSMLSVMKKIRYTNTYKEETEPIWLSEFCAKTNEYNLTYGMTLTEPEKFDIAIEYARNLYKQGLRNSTYWQTTHTAIYNLERKTLKICVQEKDAEYTFSLNDDIVFIDGLSYKTIKIGNQTWLAENLEASFEESEHGRYGMFYNLDEETYGRTGKNYGRLYFWNEAIEVAEKVKGWRLPTKEDFEKLKEFVGENAGTKLKSTEEWEDSSGSDNFGFNALPSGKFFSGEYFWTGKSCGFWTATNDEEYADKNAYYYRLDAESISEADPTAFVKEVSNKNITAFSIRLVKE